MSRLRMAISPDDGHTEQERAARRACYQAGWADALAALMVSANTAVERCEATAVSFAQVPARRGWWHRGVEAETGARLMRAAAQQIRNIVATVQEAQAGAKP